MSVTPLWEADIKDASRGLSAIETELLDSAYASSLLHLLPDMCLPRDALMSPQKLGHLESRSEARKLASSAGISASRVSPSDRAATSAALVEEFVVVSEQVRRHSGCCALAPSVIQLSTRVFMLSNVCSLR
jgi:hypothetical protein